MEGGGEGGRERGKGEEGERGKERKKREAAGKAGEGKTSFQQQLCWFW